MLSVDKCVLLKLINKQLILQRSAVINCVISDLTLMKGSQVPCFDINVRKFAQVRCIQRRYRSSFNYVYATDVFIQQEHQVFVHTNMNNKTYLHVLVKKMMYNQRTPILRRLKKRRSETVFINNVSLFSVFMCVYGRGLLFCKHTGKTYQNREKTICVVVLGIGLLTISTHAT